VAGQVILSLEQSNKVVKVLHINSMLIDTDAQALAAEVLSASCRHLYHPPTRAPDTTLFSVNYNSLSSVYIPPLGTYGVNCILQTATFGDVYVDGFTLNGEPRVGGATVCLVGNPLLTGPWPAHPCSRLPCWRRAAIWWHQLHRLPGRHPQPHAWRQVYRLHPRRLPAQ
jgi:hypothetical protein